MKSILLTLILVSQVALGQTTIDSSESRIWLQTILSNAITPPSSNKGYKVANSGYALYFSQVDSLKVPYLVYVPKSYNPQNTYPLLVYLHGGVVSLSEFEYKDPEFVEEPIFLVADKYNAVVLFPFGRKDFDWVRQPKAFENVLFVIQQTKRTYNIDNKKSTLGNV